MIFRRGKANATARVMGHLPKKRGNVSRDVILRHVRATMVTVEKQYVLYIQSLSYPTCKAHALYFVICGLSGSAVFLHIISHTELFFLIY